MIPVDALHAKHSQSWEHDLIRVLSKRWAREAKRPSWAIRSKREGAEQIPSPKEHANQPP